MCEGLLDIEIPDNIIFEGYSTKEYSEYLEAQKEFEESSLNEEGKLIRQCWHGNQKR